MLWGEGSPEVKNKTQYETVKDLVLVRCRDPRTGLLVSSQTKSLNALEEEPGAGKSDGEDKTEAAAARQGCSHEHQGGHDHNGGYDDNWWCYDTQWALDAIETGQT